MASWVQSAAPCVSTVLASMPSHGGRPKTQVFLLLVLLSKVITKSHEPSDFIFKSWLSTHCVGCTWRKVFNPSGRSLWKFL